MKIKSIIVIFIVLISFSKVSNAASLTDCDYLIVVHENFLTPSTTWDDDLISLQQSRGFSPYIQIISDQTSTGDIFNIIQFAYINGMQLKYILLLGNASTVVGESRADDN